jgi:hypothetical protein
MRSWPCIRAPPFVGANSNQKQPSRNNHEHSTAASEYVATGGHPALPNANAARPSLLQPCRWVFAVCLHPRCRYLPTIRPATATTDLGCCHCPSSSGACCVSHTTASSSHLLRRRSVHIRSISRHGQGARGAVTK